MATNDFILDLTDKLKEDGVVCMNLSFSYGRALQQSALKFWSKNIQDTKGTQATFNHRAKMCFLAAKGKWTEEVEKS